MLDSVLDSCKAFWRKLLPSETSVNDSGMSPTCIQLHQAMRQRSFIEVKLGGADVVYQSMILAVDPEEQTLLIDELFPAGFIGLPGQSVQISIRQKAGRKIKFSSVILEQHSHQDTPLYVLKLPLELEVDQRRNAYRLPIGKGIAVESSFTGPNDQRYPARLCNLSSTGISMEVEVEDPSAFHYDDSLTNVAFDFAGMNIGCELVVRNIMASEPDHNRLMIGAEFVDLSPVEQLGLERSIMRVQRDRLKYASDMESNLALV